MVAPPAATPISPHRARVQGWGVRAEWVRPLTALCQLWDDELDHAPLVSLLASGDDEHKHTKKSAKAPLPGRRATHLWLRLDNMRVFSVARFHELARQLATEHGVHVSNWQVRDAGALAHVCVKVHPLGRRRPAAQLPALRPCEPALLARTHEDYHEEVVAARHLVHVALGEHLDPQVHTHLAWVVTALSRLVMQTKRRRTRLVVRPAPGLGVVLENIREVDALQVLTLAAQLPPARYVLKLQSPCDLQVTLSPEKK